jgi:hypothetical protein
MKAIFSPRRNQCLTRIGIFLIAVALVVGMVGCVGGNGNGGWSYTLIVDFAAGGTVTVDDLPIPGKAILTYNAGVVVNLNATPSANYRFVEWTGNASTIDDVNAASTTITMDDDYFITANFVAQYVLTIESMEGGEVTTPGEGNFAYNEGTLVNLVAEAEEGYHFANWTGDVAGIANVTAAVTSITMNSECIISANFAVDLYFWVDAYLALVGPATLPPEQRNPCLILGTMTNIVVDSVRVDLPDSRSVTIPAYTDVFTPEVDQTTLLRFNTCAPGMPIAGGEYIFTGLDMAGEPIPGATNSDIWVGVDPPDPPTNVRAELTEDGILVSWDESPIIPGSFEPAAEPQLGNYQLTIWRFDTGTGEQVYGAGACGSPYLVPQDKADFAREDRGLALSEMEDGTYGLNAALHSEAPEGSLGAGNEYYIPCPSEAIMFLIEDGQIVIG